jgi:hypothetical protein
MEGQREIGGFPLVRKPEIKSVHHLWVISAGPEYFTAKKPRKKYLAQGLQTRTGKAVARETDIP